MREHLLLTGARVLAIALLTSALCTAATVTIVVAAGEVTSSAWLGLLSALVGAASGAVAGLAAASVSALLTRVGVTERVEHWGQPLAGGVSAGAFGALLLPGPAPQEALVVVAISLMAAAAVHVSAFKCCVASLRA